MNTPYSFSHGTAEAESLKKLPQKDIINILHALPLYYEAYEINETITNTNQRVEKSLKLNPLIDAILEINHPRAQALYDFVTSSEENTKWYLENYENIKLVHDGIEILGDIFCLEDEKAPDLEGIWNNSGYTYFKFYSAQEYANANGKRVPSDWSKYIDFLPGNDTNKVKFLTKVLGLAFAGSRNWNNVYCDSGYYWSGTPNSTNEYNMEFNASNIYPADFYNRGLFFSLRCLKN